MNFQEWSGQVIKPLAEQFAKCNDAKQIEEILVRLHQMWFAEADHRVSMTYKVDECRKLIDRLNTD